MDLTEIVETQKQTYKGLMKDLINDLAEEKKKVANLTIEVDRLRKLTTTVWSDLKPSHYLTVWMQQNDFVDLIDLVDRSDRNGIQKALRNAFEESVDQAVCL